MDRLNLKREFAVWKDYALLDSGEEEKCERFGDIIMIRPDPQALWKKSDPKIWSDAHLIYSRKGREGDWEIKKPVPDSWTVAWENLKFHIRPTNFKHTGLFPEQATNWKYLRETLKPGMKVLNLFGYTGGASVAAASVDADVTHVDASKPVVTWGRENLELSGMKDKKVRWIVDDAAKFVARELRRGNIYDAVLMDPPAFGRGPEGEVWQFEKNLPPLIDDVVKILNPKKGLLLVNAYSLGYPALAIENMMRSSVPFAEKFESVELTLKEEGKRGFELPTGIVVRATWGM
jgi:23S rRNA (cytosine1962-C5)-methyltransferase